MTVQEADKLILEAGIFSAADLEDFRCRIAAHQQTVDDEILEYGSTEDTLPLSLYSVMMDAEQLAKDIVDPRSAESPANRKSAKAFLNRVLEMQILLGVYVPVSDEEYRNASVFGGSKRQIYPKFRGKRYTFGSHPAE